MKCFPHTELLVQILSHAVSVAVGSAGDLGAALQYGNHSLVTPYASTVVATIVDDVRLGRSFVFP